VIFGAPRCLCALLVREDSEEAAERCLESGAVASVFIGLAYSVLDFVVVFMTFIFQAVELMRFIESRT